MNIEQSEELARRASMHAALADPTRLLITDTLAEGDASPSELGTLLAMPVHPGAVDAARRHDLPLPRRRPRHVSGTLRDGDLIITVCDRAHEELGQLPALHWSVPDPVPAGDHASFDAALDDLRRRVGRLAPRVREH